MEFLGIGPLEFLLIVVIALIVLGPQGMVKSAREAGKFIRKIVRSPLWRDVMDTSREIRDLPRKVIHEAGIEEDLKELKRSTEGTISEIKRSGGEESDAKKNMIQPENKPNEEDKHEHAG